MIIHNNLAALQTLSQMNKNSKKSEKASRELSTGEKITNAADGASEYAISEKMRAKIRGLDQCVANTKNGKNMLDTASKAAEQQVEIMKKVRSLALKSSDGIYTQQDRDILQSEVNQLLDECEDLAQQTNFNGIPLLNRYTITDSESHFDPLVGDIQNPGNVKVIPEATNDPNKVYNLNQLSYKDCPQSAAYTMNSLTIMPSVNDIIYDISDPANPKKYTVIQDPSYPSTPGLVGYMDSSNTFQPLVSGNISSFHSRALFTSAPVVGDTIYDINGKTQTLVQSPVTGNPATKESSGYTYLMNFSDLFSSGLNIPKALNDTGFSVKCLDCLQHMSFRFVADADTPSYEEAPDATGNPIMLYNIGVKNVRNANDLTAAIFNSIKYAKTGLPRGYSLTTPPAANSSAQIASHHNVTIHYNQVDNKIIITKDSNRTQMFNGIVGKVVTTNFYEPYGDLALQTETTSSQYLNTRLYNTTLDTLFPPADPLILLDPKESDYPTDWPNEYEWNHKENRPMTEDEKKAKWKEEVWKYPANRVNLDTAKCIRTREQAAEFIDDVDQAIKYLLYTNTLLGAQSNRLNYTEANLITAAENTTGSESTIRDANMAKSMVEFTKNNILVQASQSMLAQANQTPQGVLSLLQ